jgi:hypothetical protein
MRVHARRFTFICLLLVVVLAGGCATSRTSHVGATSIQITVENAQLENVAVYIVRTSTHVRLGVVDGFGTRTFALPAGVSPIGTVALHAESLSGREIQTSHSFELGHGRHVFWTLRPNAVPSSLIVR